MKQLKVLTALAMGIMASSSGVLQVKATDYFFYENFDLKEVADFTDFRQSFISDTYNLDGIITFRFEGMYYWDSCPTAFTNNTRYLIQYRLNLSGSLLSLGEYAIPDFVCTTTPTSYLATGNLILPSEIVEAVINDDANSVEFRGIMFFTGLAAQNGRTLYLSNYKISFNLSYNFNTTYLFNYFLSDQYFEGRTISGGTWTFNSDQTTKLNYVYTTAGNDTYTIVNSSLNTIGTTRKKYAIDSDEQFFRGESVGAEFFSRYDTPGSDDSVLFTGTGTAQLRLDYVYYFLNTANLVQPIVDVPIFEFEEEDCGSFLALNVGCFINNGFAYITNDAPIVSDAFTLLNAGISIGAQTFGIIGAFADDNVFGVLILAGFGFIAVKWFLKND